MSDPKDKKKAIERLKRDLKKRFNDKRKYIPKIEPINKHFFKENKNIKINDDYLEELTFNEFDELELEEVLGEYHVYQTVVRDEIFHSDVFRQIIKDLYKSLEPLACYVVSDLFERYFDLKNFEMPDDMKNDIASKDSFFEFLNKSIDYHSQVLYVNNTEMTNTEKRLNACVDLQNALDELVKVNGDNSLINDLVTVIQDNIFDIMYDGIEMLSYKPRDELTNLYPEVRDLINEE